MIYLSNKSNLNDIYFITWSRRDPKLMTPESPFIGFHGISLIWVLIMLYDNGAVKFYFFSSL